MTISNVTGPRQRYRMKQMNSSSVSHFSYKVLEDSNLEVQLWGYRVKLRIDQVETVSQWLDPLLNLLSQYQQRYPQAAGWELMILALLELAQKSVQIQANPNSYNPSSARELNSSQKESSTPQNSMSEPGCELEPQTSAVASSLASDRKKLNSPCWPQLLDEVIQMVQERKLNLLSENNPIQLPERHELPSS